MIQSVEFRGTDENPYLIRLVRPDSRGFIIREIEGLGAGQAELHTQGRASMDGDVVNGARLPARNIVFNLGYGQNLDPFDGRELSYDLFPLKKQIEMIFTTDRKVVTISGYIESNEPDIFTNEPGFEVGIMCENPYFKSMASDQTRTRLFSLEKAFEFPFANNSLTQKLLILGEHVDQRFVELRYTGNVENGALFRMLFNGPVTNPSIRSERTDEGMRITSSTISTLTGGALRASDVIEINTVRGSRSIHLIREGIRYNILNALSPTSKWITLERGLNPLSIYADNNISNYQVEILNDSLYSGI